MSYGGIMSDTLGCQMGDVFRAIAPCRVRDRLRRSRRELHGQVAVWMSNGRDNDTVCPRRQERASRDFWVARDHCQMTSMPVDPTLCRVPGL